VETVQRLEFLRDGLRHLRLVRDMIALAYSREAGNAIPEGALEDAIRALVRLQADVTPRHVVWGHVVNRTLERRGIRPFRRSKKRKLPSLDGM
jgi:hypothetical protein